jgi:hypothetical protein
MLWVPAREHAPPSTARPVAPRTTAGHARATAPLILLPQPPDASSAISVPPAPQAKIDWSAQLGDAARSTLDQERHEAELLGALTRKYTLPDDPRDPHPDPVTGFRWYNAGSHRIDTRGSLPVLHLNDRCALVLFIMPICLIGHIEIHGDLFENAAALHDERTSTARPNDVP